MPRSALFSKPAASQAALIVAMGTLLGLALVLAARTSEPDERRVSWRDVSLVLPGGFAAKGPQNGGFAAFQDRLRPERDLLLFRLAAHRGAGSDAYTHGEATAAPRAAPDDGFPEPEQILRIMFPRLLGGLRLPSDARLDVGAQPRPDGTEAPFAAWFGVTGDSNAAVGRPTRMLIGVVVTTDGLGSYAVVVLRDPAYRQENVRDRVDATRDLLQRTLQTLRFREPAAETDP